MALEGKTNRHLFVSGYNTDPRELWQIPEVKVYFRELVWKALITLYFHPASIQLIYQINYHKGVPLEILPEDYKHFVYGQFKVQNDLMEETHPDFEKTVKQIVDRTQQAFNLDLTTPEKAVAAMSV